MPEPELGVTLYDIHVTRQIYEGCKFDAHGWIHDQVEEHIGKRCVNFIPGFTKLTHGQQYRIMTVIQECGFKREGENELVPSEDAEDARVPHSYGFIFAENYKKAQAGGYAELRLIRCRELFGKQCKTQRQKDLDDERPPPSDICWYVLLDETDVRNPQVMDVFEKWLNEALLDISYHKNERLVKITPSAEAIKRVKRMHSLDMLTYYYKVKKKCQPNPKYLLSLCLLAMAVSGKRPLSNGT